MEHVPHLQVHSLAASVPHARLHDDFLSAASDSGQHSVSTNGGNISTSSHLGSLGRRGSAGSQSDSLPVLSDGPTPGGGPSPGLQVTLRSQVTFQEQPRPADTAR